MIDPAIEMPAPEMGDPQAGAAPVEEGEKQPSESERNHVTQILKQIKAAEDHWKPMFDRMREDVRFAEGNHYGMTDMPGLHDDRIKADITSRHITLRTAALYARNPTVTACRRDMLDFLVWDEDIRTLLTAQQRLAGALPTTPEQMVEDAVLLEDVKEGMTIRQSMDKLGRTLEIVFKHALEHEQIPPFKTQLKGMIPRTTECGVAYLKLGYQRLMGRKPGVENRLDDMRDRIARVARLMSDWQDSDGSYEETRAEFNDLQAQLKALQAEQEVILREGLIFDFPKSWNIIPDKKCANLVGFAGSEWVSEVLHMGCEDIEETWNVKVAGKATGYTANRAGELTKSGTDETDKMFRVFVVYNRRTELHYVVCEGYEDFLLAPSPPPVRSQFFWPWYALIFNHTEQEASPFPKSDVRLIMPIQQELNRTLESLRQHRIANQPKYLGDANAFEQDEKVDIAGSQPHELILIKAIAEGKKIGDIIAAIPKQAIDPACYSTDVIYESLMRVIGSQEANFGGTSGGDTTATESSIAEASRLSSQESNADDLEDMLSLVARNAGELLLMNMAPETAKRVAGRGAMWATLTRKQVAEEVFLEVEAGSMGRPNSAQEAAVFERMAPTMLQIPGVSPQKLGEYGFRIMNSRLKISDMMDPMVTQSIVAMNRGPMGSNPGADPNQQGGEGGDNAKREPERPGGPQPAMSQKAA